VLKGVKADPEFSRIGIVGIGLIGGSLGLAIKHTFPDCFVLGVEQDEKSLSLAKKRGAIDKSSRMLEALQDVDLVLLATPIQQVVSQISILKGIIRNGTVVSDTGSTKQAICEAGIEHLPHSFVGGHPLVGSERQGIASANPFLFQNAIYVLTPFDASQANAKRLANFLEKLGAEILFLDPASHDQIAAFVSHLPQLVAVSLGHLASARAEQDPAYRQLAAGGFRDLTRIASSPYSIWQDILKTNWKAVEHCLDDLIFVLSLLKLQPHLNWKDMERFFADAKEFRESLPVRSKGLLKKLPRLAVLVPDRPGTLAEITSALAKEKINIKDLELLKVREHDAGTFHFYFETSEEVGKAAQLLHGIGYECQEGE
jgi:prephenate dehydrogenase